MAIRRAKASNNITKQDKIMKCISIFLIFIVLSFALFLTANISLKYKVVGDDFRFHLKAAEIYAQGKNALLNKEIVKAFGGPYPPLFHLFLAIFVKLGIVMQTAAFLQIIFYPLILLSTAFLVWRKKGIIAAAFTIVLMFTSIALFDRGAQVTPQAIDMILFPLAVFFFLKKRKIPFIVLMLIMIYSHGYFSLLLLLAVALFAFIEKKNRSFIITTFLFALPLIILCLKFVPSYISARTEPNLLLADPLFVLSYFGINLALFLPLALVYFLIDRKNLDEFDKMSFYWLLATLLFAFIFSDRLASYAVMPASIIISRMFTKFTAINKLIGILVMIQLFVFGFFANFMKWLSMLHGMAAEIFNVA